MKYALFEFVDEDGAMDVGESSWIEDCDPGDCNTTDFDMDEDVIVNWPRKRGKQKETKTVVARVLHFNDDKKHLQDIMLRLTDGEDLKDAISSPQRGRGMRKRKQQHEASSESEDVEEPKSQKKSRDGMIRKRQAQNLLQELMNQKETAVEISDSETRLQKIETEIATLKDEVVKLQQKLCRPTPTNVCVTKTPVVNRAPKITKTLDKQNPTEDDTSLEPDDADFNKISQHILARSNRQDARKFTNDLMNGLFSEEIMRTHSVTGVTANKGSNPKPALPKEKLIAIVDCVRTEFPDKDATSIRMFMREKLGNVIKTSKKSRHGTE